VILQSRNTLHSVRLDSEIYITDNNNNNKKKNLNEVQDTTELPFYFCTTTCRCRAVTNSVCARHLNATMKCNSW
jgi:hypothetical protein